MHNFFLRLKHWQLFLFFIVVPVLFQLLIVMLMDNNVSPIELIMHAPAFLFPFVMFSLWNYSVATTSHKILPQGMKMNLVKFKIFFFVPILFVLFIGVFVIKILSLPVTTNIRSYILMYLFTIPLQLFAVFCYFYSMYFIAKSVKSIELQKEATTNEFMLEFFLLLIFPIGLWIIQPLVNKLFTQDMNYLPKYD